MATTTVNGASAERKAKPAIKYVAKAGYAARGVVYLLIGSLALMAAISGGGKTAGSRGALATIRDEPYGQVMLVAIALGLLCYALWRAVQAVKDPSDHGSDAKGVVIRAALGVSAVTHTFLAIYTLGMVFSWGFGSGGSGAGGGSGGESSAQSWSGWLLAKPFGQWILAAIGLAIAGAGVGQIVRGFKEKYRKHLKLDYQKQRWADPACKAGLYARGAVFVLVGGLFVSAAVQHNKFEAGGLGKGLRMLQQQPYGWFLLAVVSLGLISFGVYSMIEARYRRIGPAE